MSKDCFVIRVCVCSRDLYTVGRFYYAPVCLSFASVLVLFSLVGKVYNVTFEDITMDHAVMGLAISMLYASGGQRAPPTNETTPHIENISYRRITGTAGNAGAFLCLPESECRGIHLEDVNIDSFLGGFECIRAAGTTAGTVTPSACF